jgi:hypothetical protein
MCTSLMTLATRASPRCACKSDILLPSNRAVAGIEEPRLRAGRRSNLYQHPLSVGSQLRAADFSRAKDDLPNLVGVGAPSNA